MNKLYFATFIVAAFCSLNAVYAQPDIKPTAENIKVKFLGTGAADWHEPRANGEFRRLTSTLINDAILIDFTSSDRDMLPEDFKPEAIFYTHSHGDHFNAEAALKLGASKVYVGESWIKKATDAFKQASMKYGIAMPEIVPVKVGNRYVQGGLVFLALPGNHATGDLSEQALIYVVEAKTARLLYATDTAGITGVAAKLAGIDSHNAGTPVTAIIMEATIGLGYEDDYRIFNHSSVALVDNMVKMLRYTRRYTPKPGQNVWLTHLANTLHPSQADLDRTLPKPLKAAYDGLEVTF